MFTEPRYVGQTNSPIIPLFIANWLDFSRGSTLHYLDCMYLYWGLAAIFAIVWAAAGRRLARRHEVDQLTGARHVDGVGRDMLTRCLAFWALMM